MKQTKKKSKCIGCGKQFTVNARNQHYCSVECREYERKKRHAQMYKKRKTQKKAKRMEEKKKEKHLFKDDKNMYCLKKNESFLLYMVLIASTFNLLVFRMNILNRFSLYFTPFVLIL